MSSNLEETFETPSKISKYNFINNLLLLTFSLIEYDSFTYIELTLLNANLPLMVYEYIEWYHSIYSNKPELLETCTWAPRAFPNLKASISNKLPHNLFETFQIFVEQNPKKYDNLYEYLDTIDMETNHKLFSTICNLLFNIEYNLEEYIKSDIVQMYRKINL